MGDSGFNQPQLLFNKIHDYCDNRTALESLVLCVNATNLLKFVYA